ncbi:flagellar hook-length control protein FliK [Sphingomonas turrisvirgatae]|uniref:Flagellar hook-length control protein-like C-terminal domain-containing protein n=1 Tax=Sphingomonas turrisvirgatae TaxID=1888892 RepID=A0A1E3LV47_9SPHN|nr:flagellar hook-length control protein FliK [Sphingomonas turrisvirgatae]ODP37628.1 hypothetical protein BFL28_16800 [Sphingomonas turrisvirgatae]
MPDLLASIQITPSLPALAAIVPLRAAPVALPGSAMVGPPGIDFGAALVGLLDPAKPLQPSDDRQAGAADGKALPELDVADSDPLIAWAPQPLGAPPPAPTPDAEPTGDALPSSAPVAGSSPAPLIPAASTASAPVADQPPLGVESASTAMPLRPAASHAAPTPFTPGSSQIASMQPEPSPLTPPEAPPAPIAAVDPATLASEADAQLDPIANDRSVTREPLDLARPEAGHSSQPQAVLTPGAPRLAPPPRPGTPALPPAIAPAVVAPAAGASPMPRLAMEVAATSAGTDAVPPSELEPANSITAPLHADPATGADPVRRFHTVTHGGAAAKADTTLWVALQPQSPVPAAVTSGAAAQVFAAALSTAGGAGPVEARPVDARIDAATLFGGPIALETRPIPAPGTNAPLDLTRHDWPEQMIDRIAALRDAAEAADTRIKLAPENMGALEISLRREGDRVHVHFTAENPAARQLIAEAAPRLAELADARGVKLGQATVDGGSQQGSQHDAQQRQQPAQTSSHNGQASATAEPRSDERIA